MRRTVLAFCLFLALLGAFGVLAMASGIIPIEASGGHWAATRWLLEFAKRRSVSTHTLGMGDLRFNEPWLVLKGAGHYESGCRPCHGAPGFERPKVPYAMTPRPPLLAPRISKWDPEGLFYIVKHGIKFTGMPAWVSQRRDDEVHAMVAFLLALPALDEDGYRRLVYGAAPPAARPAQVSRSARVPGVADESESRALAERCVRCHGEDGLGREVAAFPKLAGQRSRYLLKALQAFAAGTRHSGIMEPVAAGLQPEEMRVLANYYGSLPPPVRAEHVAASVEAIERGAQIASYGVPSTRVPSCSDCHGPSGRRRNAAYPLLAGQYADYLTLQLRLFGEGNRGGSEYAHLMHPVAGLTAEQRRDVALYYSVLPQDAVLP